jgi:16S rRNA (cytidine1402-2'-O)-methyltransferase
MEPQKELFLVATPIGNLEDITYRAVRILSEVDIILAEDTRTTGRLLKHLDIKNRLKSYHAGNEKNFNCSMIFNTFNKAALVSENGTPCISDPGYKIVNFCHDNGIKITPIPGPNAAMTCVSASGFPVKNFLFYGFLPNKKGKRANIVQNLLENEKKTIVFYESPYRIHHLIELLYNNKPEIEVCIGREITKKFEEITKKKAKEFFNNADNLRSKGEFVVVVNNSSY